MKNAEYFPCHKRADRDNFNCLFCYCPLYVLGIAAEGSFRIFPTGIRTAVNVCTRIYGRIMKKITGRYSEILAAIRHTGDIG